MDKKTKYNNLWLKGITFNAEVIVLTGPPAAGSLRSRLLHEMKSGCFVQSDRLPPENDLSAQLGISRTQLRDALANLEQEGFITRRHGIGTVINRHVLEVPLRMDIEVEFHDMIRQCGHEPGTAFARLEEDTADHHIADKLKLAPGSPILRIRRLCTADGKPAIYCEDVIPRSLAAAPYCPEDAQSPVFQFLQDICRRECYMDLTRLRAAAADQILSDLLNVPVGTPLLNMEEVNFDVEGTPVLYCSEYFVDDFFVHTVLRKRF